MMLRRTFLLLLSLGLTGPLFAGTEIIRENHREVRNTGVQVEALFGTVAAKQGALPYRITIRNNTGEDRKWNVRLSEGGYGRMLVTQWSETILVENGTELVREVSLPFGPNFLGYTYRNVDVSFISPGLNTISRSTGYQVNDSFPTLAVSNKLATRSLASLDDTVSKKNSSNQRFGDSFDPQDLPGDWKSYTGLDALLIDFESWKTLETRARRALLEWVRLGGFLHVYYSSQAEFTLDDLGIEGLKTNAKQKNRGRLTLGTVEAISWDGRELDTNVIRRYERIKSRSEYLDYDYRSGWELSRLLGDKPFNSILVFGILLAFAILVAPVNLFYFAGKGRRHRLFFTTPIISIGACLLIVILIFLGDGLGGKGYRTALIDLQSSSSERRLFKTQEQFSRTGVIIDTGFESEQDLLIEPVQTPDSVYAAFNRSSGRSTNYNFKESEFSGGFFRSRSEQGFFLRAVEPTRARIELRTPSGDDSPPVLVSNLPSAVREFFYRDSNRQIWKSKEKTATAPGDTIELIASTDEELEEFVKSRSTRFSDSLTREIRRIESETGRFFTFPDDAGPYLIETHTGIRWTDDELLLTGTIDAPSSAP
ncbi:MAG: hypothetical protein AAGF67_16555 [Verrucomicrobiota bacterium]